MPIPRIEIVGYPYHVIQRGNRNQKIFIKDGDKIICDNAVIKQKVENCVINANYPG